MLLPIGSVFMRVFYLILSIIVLTVQGCATNPSQTSQQDGTSKPIGGLISFDTPFSGGSSSTDKETKKSTSSFNFGKLLSGNNDSSEDVKYGLFMTKETTLKNLLRQESLMKPIVCSLSIRLNSLNQNLLLQENSILRSTTQS